VSWSSPLSPLLLCVAHRLSRCADEQRQHGRGDAATARVRCREGPARLQRLRWPPTRARCSRCTLVTVTLLRCRPRCCDAVSFSPSLCLLQQLWRARLREWFNLFLSGLEVLREERVTTLQARWRGIQARNVRRKLEAQRAKENRAALRIQVPYSTPLHSTPLHSTPLHSTPLHSTPLHSTPLHSTPLYCVIATPPKIFVSVLA
jgi:hypothetical protein